MDIALARTFLAICDTGNFVRASEQLYVTQSTVSARVKLLEDLLGQQLFIRTKAGAAVTPAGDQFKPFAEKLVQTWEQARHDVGLPDEFVRLFTIGAEFALWERLLVQWIPWIRAAVPDLAISADVGSSAYLMRQLVDGLLEMVVTYTPQHRTGIVVEPLMEEQLIFVATDKSTNGPHSEGYVYVDWGPEFRIEHMDAFPDSPPSVLSVTYGPLALQHILANGGAAYLPLRLVRPYLKEKRLFTARTSPVFSRSIFVAYLDNAEGERFNTAIQGLRHVANLEAEG